MGDEVAAEIAIREAMDANLSTAEIDEKLIASALWIVRTLWERGEISVAEEHIATEISVRVLALQREAQRVAESRSERRVMLLTPPGEQHVIALRMVTNPREYPRCRCAAPPGRGCLHELDDARTDRSGAECN